MALAAESSEQPGATIAGTLRPSCAGPWALLLEMSSICVDCTVALDCIRVEPIANRFLASSGVPSELTLPP